MTMIPLALYLSPRTTHANMPSKEFESPSLFLTTEKIIHTFHKLVIVIIQIYGMQSTRGIIWKHRYNKLIFRVYTIPQVLRLTATDGAHRMLVSLRRLDIWVL